jgi:RNA polymerase sigma-70 factor (ECF subfamily)
LHKVDSLTPLSAGAAAWARHCWNAQNSHVYAGVKRWQGSAAFAFHVPQSGRVSSRHWRAPMTAPNKLIEGNLIGEVPQLRRYARVLTGNVEQADRLVLETLSCARRKQRRWEQRTSLLMQLFTIMHGLHSDQSPYLSRKLTQTLFNVGWRSAATPEIAASAVPSGAGPAPILAHLSRLPVEQREVLMLVAVERFAYGEIATILEVPVGTVLARLKRAREAVRSLGNE